MKNKLRISEKQILNIGIKQWVMLLQPEVSAETIRWMLPWRIQELKARLVVEYLHLNEIF